MKRIQPVVFVLLLTAVFVTAYAKEPEWKLLGTRKVALRTERDVILIGPKEGLFKAIKLTVRKSGIQMKDVKVHFTNGTVIDVNIRRLIPAGGETRVIDLPGGNRYLEKVVFWYESTHRNDKRATIRLWGLR